jgi:glycosyltransferase involved in cell wall biosynthesis
MNKSFISLVSLVNIRNDFLNQWLIKTHKVLKQNFSDFEIILINNGQLENLNEIVNISDKEILKDVIILNLSRAVDPNNAIIAGLDRANGDYTIVFDMKLHQHADLILDLFKKTQENYDVVFLKYKKRKIGLSRRFFFKLFYFIFKRYSDIKLDINTDLNRIISRRALNSVLKVRENLRYMKAIYSSIGFKTSYLEMDLPDLSPNEKFMNQLKYAVLVIISFTDFINRLMFWVFITSLVFSIAVITNALLVKFLGHDIFGIPQIIVPGWTFLTILVSIVLVILCFILYIILLFLFSINNEIKKRPIYTIESIQRL